jgi:rhodanese-related sulfurtransferase
MIYLDMRSRSEYHNSHLKNSINVAIDLVNDNFFTKFKPSDMDEIIGDNKEKKELFKNRKRKFIYIIPSI